MIKTAVIVVLDSLRYDIWNRYIHDNAGTLSWLADSGTAFEHATATAPWSLPSHASILTGLDPTEHQTLSVEDALPPQTSPLPNELPTETATACFTANPFVTPEYGFDNWDTHKKYWMPYPEATKLSPSKSGWQKYPAALTTAVRSESPLKSAINGLSRVSDRVRWCYDDGGAALISDAADWVEVLPQEQDAFLFLNLMETHDPHRWMSPTLRRLRNITQFRALKECRDKFTHGVYEGEYTLDDLDTDLIRKLLRNELKHVDHQLTRLRQTLKEENRLSDAFILVCSDHGDGFGEEGFVYHVSGLTESILNTPLVIRSPNSNANTVSERVSLAWIAPTIREYFGKDSNINLLQPETYPQYVGARNTGRLKSLINKELPEKYTVERRSVYSTEKPGVAYYRIGNNYKLSKQKDTPTNKDPEDIITTYEANLESISSKSRTTSSAVEDRLHDLGYV
jgi:arylsulfatase A-like enzyme